MIQLGQRQKVVVVIGFAIMVLPVIVLPVLMLTTGEPFFFLIVFVYIVFIATALAVLRAAKARQKFWRQFAQSRGWTYAEQGDVTAESALLITDHPDGQMTNLVTGQDGEGQIRIFNFVFTEDGGRHRRTYPYTVFAFKFAPGYFPHLYLDHLHNRYGEQAGVKIPLPAEFERQFRLFAPKEYEIEALEIFTPDRLARLLDINLKYDLELVEQELMIFVEGYVDDLPRLEKELILAEQIKDLFAPALGRFRFEAIGGHSTAL